MKGNLFNYLTILKNEKLYLRNHCVLLVVERLTHALKNYLFCRCYFPL